MEPDYSDEPFGWDWTEEQWKEYGEEVAYENWQAHQAMDAHDAFVGPHWQDMDNPPPF